MWGKYHCNQINYSGNLKRGLRCNGFISCFGSLQAPGIHGNGRHSSKNLIWMRPNIILYFKTTIYMVLMFDKMLKVICKFNGQEIRCDGQWFLPQKKSGPQIWTIHQLWPKNCQRIASPMMEIFFDNINCALICIIVTQL